MTTGLLATKFYIPPWRSTSVSRPRLVEQLCAGLEEARRLTLVSAPAGYGKTTLMAEWVHSLRGGWKVAWLSLDAADNDPSRFLAYFLAAFQQAAPAVFEAMPSLLNIPQLPPVQVLLDGLINRLSLLESSILLILDDYQVVSNPVIHDALAYLIDHQPAGVHLVLLTRQDPPLPLPRLRASRQMTELRAQHLRFTPEEAGQFFTAVMALNLPGDAAAALGERTEGWAVGLQLAGLALQNTSDPTRFIQSFRGSHRYVLDYLAEEVIAQQSDRIRSFLIQTSILDQFNADLSTALTGQPDAQAVIARLEKANLFIIPLDDERVWYRYHHLFRDYLTTMLEKPEQAGLYKKASAWHEAHHMAMEAVQYALASGDPNFAADVVERSVNQNATWSGGNIALLISWLEALPEWTLQARPRLTLNASRIFYLGSQYPLAEKHLAQAEQALREQPQTPETEQLLALAALYRGSIACVRGDSQQAIEQTSLAQARLSSENHLAHARAYFNLGQAYETEDQLDRAVENYLHSSERGQRAGVHFLAIQARCAAAQTQIRQGRFHLAEQTCREAIEMGGGERIPPLGLVYIVLGSVALERNDIEAAESLLQNGIALSREGGLMDNAVLGLAALARLRACQGDADGALSTVQEARSVIQAFGVPLIASYAAAFLARLQLAIGQTKEALQWAEGYQAARDSAAAEYEDLTLARVLLAAGRPEAVPALLQPVLDQAGKAGRQFTCMETMILLSMFYQAKNQPAQAEDWLARALVIGAPICAARVFLDAGRPLFEILPKVRAASPAFVDTLLQGFAPEAETAAQANAGLVEPLSAQELRVLGLIVAGRSNQEIAEELVISVGTAKWHVHNILQKLGVNNRPQAIARARELGL